GERRAYASGSSVHQADARTHRRHRERHGADRAGRVSLDHLQLQAAASAPDGSSVASDIWAGIGFALILAFLTAISYAQLARIYPEAGFGSCYYFAEKAFLDRENKEHHRWARLAKIVTGWATHLFYWVYPGVMVAMMATLVGHIYHPLTG